MTAARTIAFVSDVLPRHLGSGSAVYPHFVLQALAAQGVAHETIVPDGLATFRAPYAWKAGARVVGWAQLGPLSFSFSPFTWALYMFRQLRRAIRLSRPAPAGPAPAPVHRPRKINTALSGVLRRSRSQVVLVNHPYRLAELDPALTRCKTVMVLTHDVISDRAAKFAQMGWFLDFEPLTRDEEASLLVRAQVVVAISDDDRVGLEALAPGTHFVTCFPPFYNPALAPARPERPAGRLRCLFVGSGAIHNRRTLDWLLAEAWPAAAPGMELHVVGGVGLQLNKDVQLSSVRILGPIRDISAVYGEMDLALALVLEGTGVKMKLLEAVRFGAPAVTTPEGLRGLPGNAADVFPATDNGQSLAALLSDLTEPGALEALVARQQAWAREHLAPEALILELMKELPD